MQALRIESWDIDLDRIRQEVCSRSVYAEDSDDEDSDDDQRPPSEPLLGPAGVGLELWSGTDLDFKLAYHPTYSPGAQHLEPCLLVRHGQLLLHSAVGTAATGWHVLFARQNDGWRAKLTPLFCHCSRQDARLGWSRNKPSTGLRHSTLGDELSGVQGDGEGARRRAAHSRALSGSSGAPAVPRTTDGAGVL